MASPLRGSGTAPLTPSPVGSSAISAPIAPTLSEELLFEPTGDLWKDYAAYCEIDKRPERDELVDAIKVYDPALGPFATSTQSLPSTTDNDNETSAVGGVSSVNTTSLKDVGPSAPSPFKTTGGKAEKNDKNASISNSVSGVAAAATSYQLLPPTRTVTSVIVRNLDCCLNKRDLTPLTSAMPHCPSLVSIHMTGCGVTDQSYKLLCEAAYKSPSLTALSVDFNPSIIKDPTVGRKDRTEITLYPSQYRGASMRLPDCDKDQDKKEMKGVKDAAKKGKAPTQPTAAQQAAAQFAQHQADELAGVSIAEKQPCVLPSGWHGMLFSGIHQLSLRGNGITCKQAEQLAHGLVGNTELLSLNLWGNKIGAVGGCALMKTLAMNKRLTALDLGHNQITDSVLVALAETCMSQDLTLEDAMKVRTRAVKALPTTLPITAYAGVTAAANASAANGTTGGPGAPPAASTSGLSATAAAVAVAQQAAQQAGLGPCGHPLPGIDPPTYPMYIELFGVLPTDEVKAAVLGGTTASPVKKKVEAKGKKAPDMPTDRPKCEFDRDCVRMDENTLRVPGNTTLWAVSFAQNSSVTSDGVRALAAALRTREPNYEELHGQPPDNLNFAPYVSSSIALEKVDVRRTHCGPEVEVELKDAMQELETYRVSQVAQL